MPSCGISIDSLHKSITFCDTPLTSFPKTRAKGMSGNFTLSNELDLLVCSTEIIV